MALHTTPDSYTKLLIHSDTTDTSTTFVDSSANNHTITIQTGTPTHSDSQKKFGDTSLGFTRSTGEGLELPNSTDFDLDTADYTVDFWWYISTLASWLCAFEFGHITSESESMYGFGLYSNVDGMIRVHHGGSNYDSNSGVSKAGQWQHIAAVRSSGNLTVYVDGVSVISSGASGAIGQGANSARIGRAVHTTHYFDGYIDEFRYSKGVARWTDSFVPPNKPYSVVDDDFVTDVAGIEDVGDGITKLSSDIIIKSNPDEASTDSVFSASAKDGTVLMDVLASGKTTVKGRLGAEGSTSVQKVYRIPHPDGVTTFTHTVNVESTLGGWRQGGIVQLIVKCYQTDYWYGLIWWTNNGGGSTNLNSVTEVVLSSSGITVDATVGSEANDIDIEFSGMHDNNHGYINNIIYDIYDVLGD